jgi:hypothetical protein
MERMTIPTTDGPPITVPIGPERPREPAREFTIHACDKGGFMVYGPAQVSEAFLQGRPVRPVAAFSTLAAALNFIEVEMSPPDTEGGE